MLDMKKSKIEPEKDVNENVTVDKMVRLARRLGMSKTADLLEEYGPELEEQEELEDL